jgi:hypothetical protein
MAPIVTQGNIDHGDSETGIIVTQLGTLSVQSELQNSPSCADSSRTFHGFTNLPKELQLLIIRFHCETSRLVPIWLHTGVFPASRFAGRYENDQEPGKYLHYEVFSTDSPEPAIMMVNKEIREEVQRSGIYQNLFFETKKVLGDWHGLYTTYCTNIWVNKNDLVCPTIKGERDLEA